MLLNEVKPLYENFNFSGFNSENRTFGALLKSDKPLNDVLKEIMIDNDVSPEDYRKLLNIRLYDAAAVQTEYEDGNDSGAMGIWRPEDVRARFRRIPVSVIAHFSTYEKTIEEDEPDDYEWNNLSYRSYKIYVGLGNANECFEITWKSSGCTYEKRPRRGLSKVFAAEHNVNNYYKQRRDGVSFKLLFDTLEQWVIFK